MAIQLKQISLPEGATTTAVLDGEAILPTDAAELIAGTDPAGNAQFVSTSVDGKVLVSDGGTPLGVESEQLPAALFGGRLDTNLGSWFGSTTPTIGQKPMTGSLPVTVASDQVVTVQGDPLGEPLRISVPSVTDVGNSTEVLLAPGETFTGTAVFVRDYASIGIHVYANVGSATDGLRMQWSTDGVSLWSETLEFTVHPSIGASFSVGPRSSYFRVSYTNGGTAQTTFRLQTILHYSIVRAGTTRINTPVDGELDATVVKSVVAGKTTAGGGGYIDVKVSPSGALAADVTGTVAVSNLPASQVIEDGGGSLTVDGTVTANVGTTGGLALDATLTGESQRTQIRGGTKGGTFATEVTSSESGPFRQLLDVAIYDASGTQITSFGGGSGGGGGVQYADGAARDTATGTLLMVDDGTNIQSVSGDVTGRLNVNAIVSGGAKGATTAGDVTSTNASATRQLLDVAIRDASGNQITSFGGAAASATATASQVNQTITGTTMLIANASRRGATIYNDAPAALYIKLGAAPLSGSDTYTVKMLPDSYYEVPFSYTGFIGGVWATTGSGVAKITELT